MVFFPKIPNKKNSQHTIYFDLLISQMRKFLSYDNGLENASHQKVNQKLHTNHIFMLHIVHEKRSIFTLLLTQHSCIPIMKYMANIKSAKKRILQDAKKALRNKIIKSQTQTAIKKYRKLAAGNKKEALPLLKNAIVLLDKTASKGVFHRNKSSRIKARLCKHFTRTYSDSNLTQSTTKDTTHTETTDN